MRLSEVAYRVGSGLDEIEALEPFYTALRGTPNDDRPSEFDGVETRLSIVVDKAIKETGLRWRLDFLNKAIGSLRKGDFGYIFARPESGKTTFLHSEVSHMLKHTDGNIVWFNNEEQDSKVILRFHQSYFGIRLEQLLSNVSGYEKLFEEQTGGRFKFFSIDRCNRRDAERIFNLYNPVLTVYDQLDKFKGFDADREDLRLGAIYIWAREMAKQYGAGIGVCQADGSAEGVRWLTMDHCSNAKTSKQAEADWMIGIGKTHSEGAEFIRYLSICKNKLLGDPDSIESLKHGRTEILLHPEIARYKDIIKYD